MFNKCTLVFECFIAPHQNAFAFKNKMLVSSETFDQPLNSLLRNTKSTVCTS